MRRIDQHVNALTLKSLPAEHVRPSRSANRTAPLDAVKPRRVAPTALRLSGLTVPARRQSGHMRDGRAEVLVQDGLGRAPTGRTGRFL